MRGRTGLNASLEAIVELIEELERALKRLKKAVMQLDKTSPTLKGPSIAFIKAKRTCKALQGLVES